MPTFSYNALTDAGRLMTGTIEAPSREQADDTLAAMKLDVRSIEKVTGQRPRTQIGRTEFMLFNQQLASLTKAGIPLSRGLRELAGDVATKRMRRLVLDVADDLDSGTSIEDAFQKREGMFPSLYGRIIKAGVQTGRLSEMLTSLNRHLESVNLTRRILFEAMSYPVIVIAIAAVIVTAVFRIVVPSFIAIYEDIGSRLPWITKALLAMSGHVSTFWICVGAVVAAIALLLIFLSGSAAGRRFKEAVLIKVPVLGRLHHRGTLARVADAMGLLVAAGCDMPTCLRLGAGAAGSELMMAHCEKIARNIESGQSIIEAGALDGFVPRLFLYSIQLGSQRNELQDNLLCLADMYRQQVQMDQSQLQALLLPIMLVIVGTIVSFVVMGMFLPMITLIDTISS